MPIILAFALAGLACCASAQDAPAAATAPASAPGVVPASAPTTSAAREYLAGHPETEVVRLEREYLDAMRAFMRAYHAEQTAATQAAAATRPVPSSPADMAYEPPAEREPDWSKHPVHAYRPKFRALAEKYAGRPEAIRALAWLVAETTATPEHAGLADAEWALGVLARDHAMAPDIEEALWSADVVGAGRLAAPVDALYERVLATNPDRKAQASALFCQATTLLARNNRLRLTASQREQNRQKVLQNLHAIQERYADLDVAQQIAGFVYEAEHLQIGMPAPEIVGTDVDGREVRLSQFRGQVVLLDFWGFW